MAKGKKIIIFEENEFANMALEMMICIRRRSVAQGRIDFCYDIMRQMELDYSKPGRADKLVEDR